MKRLAIGIAVLCAASGMLVTGAGLAGSPGTSDGGSAASGIDATSAIVELKGDSLSTYEKTKPPKGKKIDFDSAAVKSYRARLNALRNSFKQWLQQNARAVNVTGEFDIGLNAVSVELNGTSLSLVASAPMVARAEFQQRYTPQIDPDLTLINAFAAWGAGGGAGAGVRADGTRVKIGIIDTGIDQTHPCFNDAGYSFPAGFPKGDTSFTNKKVVVARVFANSAKQDGLTPAAEQAHGTHVSGTAACNYGLTNATTTVNGVAVSYGVLGVAPGAQLGNYNVFPDGITNARTEDILNAYEAAYADGMDVTNASIGGPHIPPCHGGCGSNGVQDLLMVEVNHLDQAGMVNAVAAGNSGPGFNTIESPGAASRALTAGAVTVGHYIGVDVTNDTDAVSYAAAVGQFGPSADTTGALTANLGTFCDGSGSLAGMIALIDRGVCTFSTKIRNAQTAGAVGAIVVNNVFGPPISMAQDGTPNQPTIPGVMVSRSDRTALSGAGSTGDTFTIHSAAAYVQNLADSNYLAGFSSRGPTNADFRVKPDVTAPGVNVLSSIPNSGPESCVPTFPTPCWAFMQGTSMATPHLAGSAAVVLGQHPSWAPWQVRSAIVNTADEAVKDGVTNTPINEVNAVGSGRENLNSAVSARVALNPVSVTFGAVPSGSGKADTQLVELATLSGSGPYTVSVTNETCTGVDFGATISDSTIAVTMNADKGVPGGSCQGTLRVSNGSGEIAHAAVYALVK